MTYSINELVSKIPHGKKIAVLGRNYVEGLINFSEQYGDEVNIDDLIEDDFDNLILENSFIDLLLDWSEDLLNVMKIPTSSIKSAREGLIDKFCIEYNYDDNVVRELPKSTEAKITLHDFQERIRRKVLSEFSQKNIRFLLHMPTGSGKTRTASEIILDFIRMSPAQSLFQENIKILWIAQSEELCFQAMETIKWIVESKNTRDIKIGNFYGDNSVDDDILEHPAIIICGIQKLMNHYTEPFWSEIRNQCYLVVVDEAHRSVANQWVKTLDYFASNSSTNLLGLTATPGLGGGDDDTHVLAQYYGNNKITLLDEKYNNIDHPIEFLVKRQYLAEIDRKTILSEAKLTKEDIISESASNFKFSGNTLNNLSVDPSRNSSIINIIKNSPKKKILVFTCGLEHNRILKQLLKKENIYSETIDGSSKNRETLINKFKDNSSDLNILLNFGVLTTGFDAPKTDVCIIARPVGSIVMYSQMVGRILRGPKNTGNKKNTLYTIKDNFNHGDYDDMFNSFNNFYK